MLVDDDGDNDDSDDENGNLIVEERTEVRKGHHNSPTDGEVLFCPIDC